MTSSANLDKVVAVVLAGGFGTHIQHLLKEIPKPMAPVNGKPFLEWLVRYLAMQGIRKVVISTGYLAETVEEHFRPQPVKGVQVQCIAEKTPLGTGGAISFAARACGETPEAWLVCNGDSLAFADLKAAACLLADEQTVGAVIGRSMEDASRYGTLSVGPEGELLRFEEKRPGGGVINTGIYFLKNSLMQQFPNRAPLSLEKEVFPTLTHQGALLKVHVMQAPFLDIGTPESLPQAEPFIRENMGEFQL
jgi:D-glycero-alpha-D-manno-heptose 1-phosphate guanylyltransferase